MKANEFIRWHGFQYTRSLVRDYPNHTHVSNDGRMIINEKDYVDFAPHFKSSLSDAVKISDLKRLIESHDLIDLCGGLDVAKNLDPRFLPNWVESVNQAIADVESCQ